MCQRDDYNHPVLRFLKCKQFSSALNPARSTHKEGRCLDQVYFRFSNKIQMVEATLKPCYFSDHDKVQVTVNLSQDESMEVDDASVDENIN